MFSDQNTEITIQPVQGSLFENDEQTKLKNINNTTHSYFLIDTIDKAKELAKKLLMEKVICFDTETTGLDPNNSELVGISFAVKPYEAWYIPISENYHEAEKIVQHLKPVLEAKKLSKQGKILSSI